MRKNNKGITLIALVVTIIILLILAGVSIMTLTGDNGIINRTHQAKQLSEEAAAREKVKLAVQAARVHDNSYSYLKASEVVTAVNNEEGLSTPVVENPSFPIVVTAGKFKFSVNELGEVGYIEGIVIPSTLVLAIGGDSQTITPELGEGITGTVIWKSEDESKVTVENGVITAIASSSSPIKVTATIKDLATGIEYSAECLVTPKNSYTVTYYGEDKTTQLQQISVVEGGAATYPGTTPTKAATADYTYTFNKWLNVSNDSDATSALASVNSTLNVYASFTQKSNIPTVDISRMGDSVEYNGDTTNWEVFFEDDENIYLIYKTSVADPITGVTGYGTKVWNAIRDTSNANTFDTSGNHKVYPKNSTYEHYSSYLNNAARFPASQKWMSKYLAWMNQNPSSYYSDYDNMLGTLFMLDTDVWQYKTLTGDHDNSTTYYNSSLAKYVIGSPTIEMMTITRNSVDSPTKTYTCSIGSDKGYKADLTDYYDIPSGTTWNHSSGSTIQYYWVSGPHYGNDNFILSLKGSQERLWMGNPDPDYCAYGYRPVVCLNSSVQLVDNSSNGTHWIAQLNTGLN